ncbi:MAG: LysR family transcriptional regulator [Oscillospiraceae bacterium]|nr:LysR family transcriptional regulator [Oscillospiraceae bacterium]
MDTKKYEVFAKTVELSSLTAAAQALGLTQSGVSHIIAAVEEELQLTLLKRSRTGARLTPEGEQLLPYIRELLRQETLLYAAAESLRGLAAGTVRIGTFTSVATHWLPGMMKEFQQLYPRVEFRLFNGDYHDVNQWLQDGSVDLGFVALPMEQDCECIVLGEDRLLAILPEGHPLSARAVCPVAEVAGEPFISLLESSSHDARRALDKAGLRPNVKFTTKDDYAILAMVRQGLGVSIMPELLLRGQGSGIAQRPLDPPASRILALALPAGERTGPAARRFAEFAAEWVQKNM